MKSKCCRTPLLDNTNSITSTMNSNNNSSSNSNNTNSTISSNGNTHHHNHHHHSILSTSEEVTRWIQSVHVDRLEELLKSDRHKIDSMDEGGMTLLHRSVLANRLEIVRLLVNLGANATLANRDGWSPLHLAAHAGNSDILGFLLKS